MAPFDLQTSNQYFQPPAQWNPSQNLLLGAETAMRAMKAKTDKEQGEKFLEQKQAKLDQEQEKAAIEKAESVIKTFGTTWDASSVDAASKTITPSLPVMREALTKTFGESGVPPSIASRLDRFEQLASTPEALEQALPALQNYLSSQGVKRQETPEQLFQKTYNEQAGKNLANIQLPVPSKEGQIKIGTRDTQQVGTQVQTIEYQGPEKGWVPVEGAVGPRFNPNTGAGGASGEEGIDIEAMANAVEEQSLSTAQIPKRGAIWSKVVSLVKKKNPKFNLMYNDANYKWFTSARGTATINMLNGSLPRVQALYAQIEELPNTSLNSWNAFKRAVVTELGYQDYSAFEANRNAIVQEVNAAISGTSQASDLRVKIELENLKTSRSPEQLRAATENLYEALTARLDSSMAGPFPPEVVNGKMSMNEYRKQITEKYKGNYERYPERRWKQQTGAQPASGGQPGHKTVVGTGTDPDTGRPVNRYSDGLVEYADE